METNIEGKKEEHLQKARESLIRLYRLKEPIRNQAVLEKLDRLIDRIKDLKDVQYIFDSGEYELDKLYDRYLPYLMAVIENYGELEETGHDPDEVERVRNKLLKALDTMMDTIVQIRDILPLDEISDAQAEHWAKKKKEELDAMFPRILPDDSL